MLTKFYMTALSVNKPNSILIECPSFCWIAIKRIYIENVLIVASSVGTSFHDDGSFLRSVRKVVVSGAAVMVGCLLFELHYHPWEGGGCVVQFVVPFSGMNNICKSEDIRLILPLSVTPSHQHRVDTLEKEP